VTGDLGLEAGEALQEILGDTADGTRLRFCTFGRDSTLTPNFFTEWKVLAIKPMQYKYVTRLSSRVFLGAELARNDEWLDVAATYAMRTFIASRTLRGWNPLLRPIVNTLHPACRLLRQSNATARKIVTPIVNARMKRRETEGGTSDRISDMIGWIDEVARGKKVTVNMEDAQLFLVVAAIHTTTETLSFAMSDILDHPEVIEPLRQEIAAVLMEHGFKKDSIARMKLLDSFLKESSRMHMIANGTFPSGHLNPAEYDMRFGPRAS